MKELEGLAKLCKVRSWLSRPHYVLTPRFKSATLLTMKPGTDGYFWQNKYKCITWIVEAYNYLGIRSLDSRGISNELYFRIREGVEEKEGASIDQSIILDYLCQSWWGKRKSPAIKAVCSSLIFFSIFNYYINTKEVAGELSRENLVSSHVKITCYLT